MAGTKTRSRVIGIAAIVIVIATSIALRKTIPDQTTRVAIGMVEIILIALLAFGMVRSR